MAKLRLDIEALDVQSFDTAPAESGRGTVQAASVETFDITCECSGDFWCTNTCTVATFPREVCVSAAGRHCPDDFEPITPV